MLLGTAQFEIIHSECLAALKQIPDCSIDAIVTDPPAGISFMSKKWDDDKGGRTQWIKWFSTIMTECFHVLKPGGYVLVWSLPRTQHWTATAIEDAGFEIRDCISHLFASGFPKSTNVGKQIDNLLGGKREVICPIAAPNRNNNKQTLNDGWLDQPMLTAPATPQAEQWEGWGTALKPAVENWILARKPLEGTIANNVLAYGTGGLNIDGCRIPHADAKDFEAHKAQVDALKAKGGSLGESWKNSSDLSGASDVTPAGRWPSPFILSHGPGCRKVGISKVRTNNTPADYSKTGHVTSTPVITNIRQGVHHGDATGHETVEQWECQGGEFSVYSFSSNTTYASSVLSSLSSLRDHLGFLLRDLTENSNCDTSVSLDASEVFRIVCTQSALSFGDLAREVGCALGLEALPSWKGCCSSCRDLCGEHVRWLVTSAQEGIRPLRDALSHVVHFLDLHVHTRSLQSTFLPSNLGDSAQPCKLTCNCEYKTSDVFHPRLSSPLLECRNSNIMPAELPMNERRANSGLNSISSPFDRNEIPFCSEDTCECYRLICLSALEIASAIPSLCLQRSRIDIRIPMCPVRLLDEQSGERPSTLSRKGHGGPNPSNVHAARNVLGGKGGGGYVYGDKGTASRFFLRLEPDPDPFIYCPKAARSEKELGLDDLELKPESKVKCTHPTVKSIALMRYLCRLITPPNGIVLDPFCGSGSTIIGALYEGFRAIGIEQEAEYVEIAKGRIAGHRAKMMTMAIGDLKQMKIPGV